MPLITCVECNKSVSTLATACPHCGAPVSASVKSSEPVLSKPNPPPSPQAPSPTDINKSEPVLSKPNPPPSPQAPSPPNVNKKVGLKVVAVLLILIGIGLIGVQASESIGSTVIHPIIFWPSGVLFVVGALLWKAGR